MNIMQTAEGSAIPWSHRLWVMYLAVCWKHFVVKATEEAL